MFPGRGYDEIAPGDRFDTTMTITETHIVLGAGLFGDFNPLHINQSFAEGSRFGSRIAHGYLTTSFMAAQLGMVFHGTAIAYVEHTSRFTAPVRAGDTLSIVWTVASLEAKPKHNGGMVSLSGVCTNQEGAKVAEAEAKMLVANNPRS
ncbi:MAG TPA: MaoC family dehydratase [Azoarcus taiwanensis]|uniref:Acyl dehydratase n=1 Tax=Azoarcus taiwanensis TaxID=666964 RepID=A0A972J939_9RHOO|nr:MaoC family dehydratase [Azoarcus taiwanensis]NMG04071.1 acyl dehydratase [Azoarcus taiwanensis]HRQ56833.1 MaoC family dehydratase [Azoarcus taiwanensis]